MEWSKVKTGLIILLAAVNVLFAVLVGGRYFSHAAAERRSFERAVSMASERVEGLDEEALMALPAFPEVLEYVRDTDAEKKAAEHFLGECGVTSPGGGVYVYESEKGRAGFRSGGYFEIEAAVDYEPDFASELKKAGLDMSDAEYENGVFTVKVGDTLAEGLSVSCRCEGGKLLISGRWCFTGPEKHQPTGTRAGLLMQLLSAMEENDLTEAGKVYLVYTAETAGEDLRLVPAWRVSWDELELTFPCA